MASIIPYHEFFEEGDVWSESRRSHYRIPTDVSRKYVTGGLELLGELSPSGLTEVSRPPMPGDPLYRIDIKSEAVEIYGIKLGAEKYIWFGSLFGYEEAPVPLDPEGLPMHLAILGITGSGKSYTAGYLIERIKDLDFRLPLIIGRLV